MTAAMLVLEPIFEATLRDRGAGELFSQLRSERRLK